MTVVRADTLLEAELNLERLRSTYKTACVDYVTQRSEEREEVYKAAEMCLEICEALIRANVTLVDKLRAARD